jgi:membrane protein implicated in regulation of membrane protease activity
MEMELLTWAAVFVVFVIAEVTTFQLVSIWFALGALVTLFCGLFTDISFVGQVAVFTLSSGIFLALTFPFLSKWRRSKNPVSTNAELDVGESAVVIEEINEDIGSGRVTLKGVDWSAVPAEKGAIIPKGAIVTVIKVQGAKLIVALKT